MAKEGKKATTRKNTLHNKHNMMKIKYDSN